MKKAGYTSRKLLVFSQWSRKSYAIFASLGKVVKIACVSADICNNALKKSSSVTGLSSPATGLKEDLTAVVEKLRLAKDTPAALSKEQLALIGFLFTALIAPVQTDGNEAYDVQPSHKKVHVFLLTIKHGPFYLQTGGGYVL